MQQPLSYTHFCMVKQALGMDRDKLEDSFDVIVVGTGLEESLLAAACARNGHSVLHLDPNDYYGGNWASFNLEGFLNWTSKQQEKDVTSVSIQAVQNEPLSDLLGSGEVEVVKLPSLQPRPRCIHQEWFVQDENAKETQDSTENDVNSPEETDYNLETEKKTEEDKRKSGDKSHFSSRNENESEKVIESQSDARDTETEEGTQVLSKPDDDTDCSIESSKDRKIEDSRAKSRKPSRSTMLNGSRHFNIDLCPRLLYCSGSMVELLISSNVSRYTEFKGITRLLTVNDEGKFESVPSSRADVFASKALSLVEKRVLMKFLTSQASNDADEDAPEYDSELTFGAFLEQQKLSKHLCRFVLDAIAIVDANVPYQHGIDRLRLFMRSLGRFGTNTPFLTPMFGSGEIPQAFCRLAAVFGAVYCLGKSIDSLIVDKNSDDGKNKSVSSVLLTDGQLVRCDHLVLPRSLCPIQDGQERVSSGSKQWLQRNIYIRSSPLKSTSDDNTGQETKSEVLSFLTLPTTDSGRAFVQELSFASAAAPKGLFLVHSTHKVENSDGPGEDLLQSLDDGEVIFKCSFQLPSDCNRAVSKKWRNVHLTSGPVFELDYDQCIDNTKSLFKEMFGEEPFLPRAPDPNEIVLGDENESETGKGKVEVDPTEEGNDPKKADEDEEDTSDKLDKKSEDDLEGNAESKV